MHFSRTSKAATGVKHYEPFGQVNSTAMRPHSVVSDALTEPYRHTVVTRSLRPLAPGTSGRLVTDPRVRRVVEGSADDVITRQMCRRAPSSSRTRSRQSAWPERPVRLATSRHTVRSQSGRVPVMRGGAWGHTGAEFAHGNGRSQPQASLYPWFSFL